MPNRIITAAIQPVLVPAVAIALVAHVLPVLQYALIKSRKVPQWAVIVVPILIGLVLPFVISCDSWLINGYYGAQHLINSFRLLDAGFVAPAMSSRWTIIDYYEYFFTFETKETRSIKEAGKAKKQEEYVRQLAVYREEMAAFTASGSKGSKPRPPTAPRKSPSDNAVPVEKRDAIYYSVLTMRVLFMWVMYNGVVWYMKYLPVNPDPPIRGFVLHNAKAIVDQAMLSINIYMLLNLVYMVLYHVIVELFGVPYQPMMDSPFISVGFRDFWSHRWNFIVKESLRRGVFQPTMALLRLITPGGKTAHFRMPAWHAIVGAIMTFFVSGMIHEWFIAVICDEPTYFEHLLFFVLQAVYTIAEVLIRQTGRKTLGYDPIDAAPKWLGLIVTWYFMALGSPLFTNPLVREGVLLKIQLPNFVV